ncbi:hypothetical protein [Reyranella sp.]|uniref:hypothetical protein n=1 Tax=Reyranella sp. TaxID=1929291 RepID=UPI0025D3F6FE|nr:hypothetical protein [Reyranella sp.]
MTSISSARIGQSSPGFVRGVAYWTLTGALLLATAFALFELFGDYADTDTYRRVYVHPERLVVTQWLIFVGLSIGLAAQLAVWKARRVTRVALAVAGLLVAFDIANVTLALNPACCVAKWPGFLLQFLP